MVITLAAASIASFAAVFVLPGLGLQSICGRLGRRTFGRAPDLSISVALSVAWVCGVGYSLIALHLFSAGTLTIIVLPLAMFGLVPALKLVTRLRPLAPAVVFVLTAPIAWPAFQPGHAPANNFNWFYWVLGNQLTAAHGIPEWVHEYGQPVRWQPDYLSLNVLVTAYRGFLPGVDPLTQLDLWKIPVAIFTFSAWYLTLRLWLARPGALVGLGAFAATTVATAKLGNGRPEILGFALGLFATVLAVRGLRTGRASLYVLASILIAIDSSVHAIGALTAGLILVSASLVELVRRPSMTGTVGRGFLIACAGVVAIGWGVQGRALVATNTPPAPTGAGDPTLRFFQLTEGVTDAAPPLDRVLNRATQVTTHLSLDQGVGVAVGALLALFALAGLAFGDRRVRECVCIAFGFALGLSALMAWFSLRYDTFVPQGTATRFAQWMPLVAAFAIACGYEVAQRIPAKDRVTSGVAALVAIGLGVLTVAFPARLPIDADHLAAIDKLREVVRPGDIVLSNAGTHGLIEFATAAEVPTEGRQPVIERRAVLHAANRYLARLTRLFEGDRQLDPVRDFDARWILITERPAGLAAADSFGGLPVRLSSTVRGRPVWQRGPVALFELNGSAVRRVGPARTRIGPFLIALAAFAVIVAAPSLASQLSAKLRRSDESRGRHANR